MPRVRLGFGAEQREVGRIVRLATASSSRHTKSSADRATSTLWYFNTSRIAVVTTGFPAAMYSNSFTGLHACVIALSTNGIVATSTNCM